MDRASSTIVIVVSKPTPEGCAEATQVDSSERLSTVRKVDTISFNLKAFRRQFGYATTAVVRGPHAHALISECNMVAGQLNDEE